MTCVSPPEPADHELLAYLDGQARASVEEHLRRCPHCRGRAEALAGIQAHYLAQLYRVACPEAHELGEFHLGLLPSERSSAVRKHLATCPHCAREVAQLEGYLDELAPEISTTPLQRLRVLVAGLFEPEERPGPVGRLVPAPAYAIRGTDEGPRLYRVDEFQIAVEVQEDAEAPGQYTLLGLVTGAGAEGLEARLDLGGRRAGSAMVDDLGNVLFSGLVPGVYDLVLRGADLEIRVSDIPVGLQPQDPPKEEYP
jgi:hypothetical protein